MKSVVSRLLLISLFIQIPILSQAWGHKGHEIVAEVAFHYLDDSTRTKVLRDLDRKTIEEAATWMDDVRSNSYYNYMRPWHYVDIEKGETYKTTDKDRDLLIIMNSAIHDLNHRSTLKQKTITEELYFIFHLTGDMHQPLHTGYKSDKGGNTIQVGYMSKGHSDNLHSVWDTKIIESQGITLDSVLKQASFYTDAQIKAIEKVNLMAWMNDSRSLLDTVYNFKDGYLDQDYITRNTIVIERQMFKAGIRLASILREVYKKED